MNNFIDKIEKAFLIEKPGIYEAINKDYKNYNKQFQYAIFEKELQNLKEIKYTSKEETRTMLIIYNGNPYLMLAVAIKALMYGNNLVLVTEEECYTSKKIIEILTNVLKQTNANLILKMYVEFDIRKILQTDKLIDRILYIGDKIRYQEIKEMSTIKDIKYNGYGSIIVYVDDEDEFEGELYEIEKYTYKNNFYLYKFSQDDLDTNLDEIITEINKDGKNDTCIILTKDETKIKKFKEKVNSTNILINEVKFNLKHELPEELFQ